MKSFIVSIPYPNPACLLGKFIKNNPRYHSSKNISLFTSLEKLLFLYFLFFVVTSKDHKS